MTNLRLVGLVAGVVGLLFAFYFFRGPRWSKPNFTLAATASVFLLVVSIEPRTVDWLRDFLALEQSEFGRLLGLLVVSAIALFVILFYTRYQVYRYRITLDLLIRGLGAAELARMHDLAAKVKPIMIIIPAYNEEENLQTLLPQIPKSILGHDVGVLVVDDGSSDATSAVAEQHGVLVVRNVINRGQGASSRLGYDILKQGGAQIGVTMDADNQHRPEDIPILIKPILDNHYDLVIGSRMLGHRDEDSAFRYTGIIILTALINFLTGQKLTDCSSGFKAFRMDKITGLKLYEEQFQAAELLIVAAKSNVRLGEVPIHIKLRQFGTTKKGSNWRYGFFFAKTIVKTWWRTSAFKPCSMTDFIALPNRFQPTSILRVF